MNTPPDPQIGPPPFRFVPTEPGRRVHAFSGFFRSLATVVVFGSASWMFHLWRNGKLVPEGTTGAMALGWPLAALAIMLVTWWFIQTSKTTVTDSELRQTWMWTKSLPLRELAYGKMIRVRGLDWLIAPRLYVRTLLGKFAVFYVADARMLDDFERLVRELQAFRGFGR